MDRSGRQQRLDALDQRGHRLLRRLHAEHGGLSLFLEQVAGARGRTTLTDGNIDGGLVWASQVVGLIDDIPTCAELIERIVTECREAMRQGLAAFEV